MPRIVLLLAALAAASCQRGAHETAGAPIARGRPGPRISMMDLHRTGGVPPSWRFTVPTGDVEAGRRAFLDLGCGSCHHVAGEASSARDERTGPDLTGMGSHHPA